MRTSTGWALANTWYDTAPAPAPRGSLLESVFTHVFVERKKPELMSTRALVQAVLPEGKKGEFLMPFLEKTETSDLDKQKKTLAEFVKYNAKINLTDYFKQQVATAKRLSLLKSLKKKKT